MLSKSNKVAKKVCVIFLVILLTALSLLPVLAKDSQMIQLSEGNVVTYPKIEGTVPYTQKIGDYLTITGGKVTTDGTEDGTIITGYWEFIDPDYTPTGIGAILAEVRFVPDESDLYDSLEISRNFNIYYDVSLAPMEFADSSTEFVLTAGSVGARLGTMKFENIDWLKDIVFKCPLTGDIIEATPEWTWNLAKSTQINESGYYPATVSIAKYTPITVYFYIKVPGDNSEPPFSMFPTIKPVTYHEGLKAGELEIVTEEDVEGTFEIVNPDQELKAGDNSVSIKFKPKDDSQSEVTLNLCAVVEKADASFINEQEKPIVPELTWTLGTKYYLTNLFSQLEKMKANCGTFKVRAITIDGIQPDGSIFVANEYKVDGYTATATLKSQENTNYTNTLKFKIIIEKNKINPDIQSQGNNMFAVVDRNIFSSATLTGRFTVEVQGEKGEYAQTITDVKLNVPFEYHPGKSGKYTFTITYDDKNDEKYELPEPVEVSKDIVLSWTVTGKNVHFDSRLANYGEEVMVDATITNDKFGGWKFYDESGKEIKDFNYTETSQNLRITFVMPDYPITVEAVDKTQSGISGGGNFSDFFSNFVKWLNNLAAKLKALFDAIAQLLTVVG